MAAADGLQDVMLALAARGLRQARFEIRQGPADRLQEGAEKARAWLYQIARCRQVHVHQRRERPRHEAARLLPLDDAINQAYPQSRLHKGARRQSWWSCLHPVVGVGKLGHEAKARQNRRRTGPQAIAVFGRHPIILASAHHAEGGAFAIAEIRLSHVPDRQHDGCQNAVAFHVFNLPAIHHHGNRGRPFSATRLNLAISNA